MPVYNCSIFITEAIESILCQTYTDFELIIIDDCSTDNTKEIVKSYTDPRIILISKTENSGISKSLNLGLQHSKGKYIARMDGDDISLPHRFQTQYDLLETNDKIILCGTWYYILNTDEIIKHPTNFEEIKLAFLNYNAIGHPTVMFRNSVFKKANLRYDAEKEPAEDYDLWIRSLKYGQIVNIPVPLYKYRQHVNQISQLNSIKQHKKMNELRLSAFKYMFSGINSDHGQSIEFWVNKHALLKKETLKQFIDFCSTLLRNNRNTLFIDPLLLQNIIADKEAELIRYFYLQKCRYSLNELTYSFRLNLTSKNSLKLFEYFKFIMKCLISKKK
jgi:glycosyltransferase involved in cell wall biosynthesis